MGKEKAFVHLAGRPLIAHCVEALKPQVRQLAINANGAGDRFASFGLPVLPDPIKGQIGPLAGILAALEWAEVQHFTAVATVPVDTPFLPPDFVARLVTALADSELACALSEGRRHYAAALFRTSLAADLRDAIKSGKARKVEDWQARRKSSIAEWSSLPIDPFFNINTPDDLANAEKLSSEGRG